MRVLIVTLYYAPDLTGIAKIMGETAEWLVAHGHQVRVITAPPHYPQWRLRPGVRERWYQQESWAQGRGRTWRCPIWVPRTQTGLKRLLYLALFALSSAPVILAQAVWRPQVVMLTEPPLMCAPATLLSATLARSLSWLNIKDYEVDAAFSLGLLRGLWLRRITEAVERWWMRRFDCVSSISPAMVERARSKGVDPRRLLLWRDFVDLEAIRNDPESAARLRASWNIAPDKIVALYSGNLGRKQGLEVVAEAAVLLQHDPRIIFVICGDGAGKPLLAQSVSNLPNVQLRDLVPAPQLNALLHMADVHLLPQRIEAADLVMPSKLFYMLASARPIIATAESHTEVGTSVTACGGTLIAPGDANGLAMALRNWADNAAGRGQAGLRGRSYVAEHFDKHAVMEGFLAAVQQFLAGEAI